MDQGQLQAHQAATDRAQATVPPDEHAAAKVKAWRMLGEEEGRYRCPIGKYESMLAAVTGLLIFAQCAND